VPADVGEEEPEAVGRPDEHLRLELLGGSGLGGVLGLLAFGARLEHLEADRLAGEPLELVVAEVLLESERLELGRLDEAALLRALEQRARRLGLKEFVDLVLGQFLCMVLGTCCRMSRR
jgi:hypothetical protein